MLGLQEMFKPPSPDERTIAHTVPLGLCFLFAVALLQGLVTYMFRKRPKIGSG